MPCNRPLYLYPAAAEDPAKIRARLAKGAPAPSRRPVGSASKSYAGARAFRVPCGKCSACLSGRARDLATRAYLHSKLEEHKYFLTLTISDEHMLPHRGIMKSSLQRFMKRARNRHGEGVSFVGVGEYGGDTARAHYHVLLFGVPIDDLVPYGKGKRGDVIYVSATINALWGFGVVWIGACTVQSCHYTTGYMTKKLGVSTDDAAYTRHEINASTGEIKSWQVEREFLLMSRRPAIGREWFQRFKGDVYPSGFVVIDGRKVPAPSYFNRLMAEDEQRAMKLKRREFARLRPEEQGEWRMAAKDESRRLTLARHDRSMAAEG
jgi:hypothetical protein